MPKRMSRAAASRAVSGTAARPWRRGGAGGGISHRPEAVASSVAAAALSGGAGVGGAGGGERHAAREHPARDPSHQSSLAARSCLLVSCFCCFFSLFFCLRLFFAASLRVCLVSARAGAGGGAAGAAGAASASPGDVFAASCAVA